MTTKCPLCGQKSKSVIDARYHQLSTHLSAEMVEKLTNLCPLDPDGLHDYSESKNWDECACGAKNEREPLNV